MNVNTCDHLTMSLISVQGRKSNTPMTSLLLDAALGSTNDLHWDDLSGYTFDPCDICMAHVAC